MKNFFYFFTFLFFSLPVFSQVSDIELKPPVKSQEVEEFAPSLLEPEELKHFPNKIKDGFTSEKLKGTHKLPLDARLRISVDSTVDAKIAMAGDYFKAHVVEDLYLPTDPKHLIVLKGSWLRGKVTFVKKPTFIVRKGEVNIKLDQITTPNGEIIPISSSLIIQKGFLNQKGLLDSLVTEPQSDLITQTYTNITAEKLDLNFIGNLMRGSLITLYSEGNDYTLLKGQELQIVLKKNLNITTN